MESGDLALVALFLIALVLVGGMFYFVYKYTKVPEEVLEKEAPPADDVRDANGTNIPPPPTPGPSPSLTPPPPSGGTPKPQTPSREETGQKPPVAKYVFKIIGTTNLTNIEKAFQILEDNFPAQMAYVLEGTKYDYIIKVGDEGVYVLGNTIYIRPDTSAKKIAHEIGHCAGLPDVHKTLSGAKNHHSSIHVYNVLIPIGGEEPGLMGNINAEGFSATEKLFYWKREWFKRVVVNEDTKEVWDIYTTPGQLPNGRIVERYYLVSREDNETRWGLLLASNEMIVYYYYEEDLENFLANTQGTWSVPKTAEELLRSAVTQCFFQAMFSFGTGSWLNLLGFLFILGAILLILRLREVI